MFLLLYLITYLCNLILYLILSFFIIFFKYIFSIPLFTFKYLFIFLFNTVKFSLYIIYNIIYSIYYLFSYISYLCVYTLFFLTKKKLEFLFLCYFNISLNKFINIFKREFLTNGMLKSIFNIIYKYDIDYLDVYSLIKIRLFYLNFIIILYYFNIELYFLKFILNKDFIYFYSCCLRSFFIFILLLFSFLKFSYLIFYTFFLRFFNDNKERNLNKKNKNFLIVKISPKKINFIKYSVLFYNFDLIVSYLPVMLFLITSLKDLLNTLSVFLTSNEF